jgi:hypothetical protein
MKRVALHLPLCLLLLPLCRLQAQQPTANVAEPRVEIELRGGVNMTHFYRRIGNSPRSIQQVTQPGARQMGYQLGFRLSPYKKRLAAVLDLSLTRNIGYATVQQTESPWDNSYYYLSSYNPQSRTLTDISYLRWDVTRVNMGILFQASMGANYDIRLLGGFEMNGMMVNRTRANYYQVNIQSIYDPATGMYFDSTTGTYAETKLLMRQFGFSLCGGVHLPVIPGSRWGFELLWRYSLSQQQEEFNLAQRSTELSLSYRLSK